MGCAATKPRRAQSVPATAPSATPRSALRTPRLSDASSAGDYAHTSPPLGTPRLARSSVRFDEAELQSIQDGFTADRLSAAAGSRRGSGQRVAVKRDFFSLNGIPGSSPSEGISPAVTPPMTPIVPPGPMPEM